jgi:uncharacterized protein (UPF0371 family)
MAHGIGFDNETYLREQTSAILERVHRFNNKLYLEFGGKLLFDYHASRVLPGYEPNVKIRLLQQLKENAEILICIYAGAIEQRKIRADFGITYDTDALKLIDDLRDRDLGIRGVVITRFADQPAASIFKNKLERRNIPVFTHRYTKGYPMDVDTIVSEEGYGDNAYISTEKPLVVVTGPGPGSGKLATCLSQLYHDHKHGIHAGYAKFETFPIWDLPLKHPVNMAYEAATADIGDFNLIDSFHLEAYGVSAVNYNRDVEVFPVLKRILERLMGGDSFYKSPTDMGVNRASRGIMDNGIIKEAARQEVIRRYFRCACEHAMGLSDRKPIERVKLILDELGNRTEDRRVVPLAREASLEAIERKKGHKGIYCGAALELMDGTIIQGSNSPLLHAASSLILHAIKHLAKISEEIPLLPDNIIESVARLKKDALQSRSVSLNLEETLIGLSISAATNPAAQLAMSKLKELRSTEAHLTHIPTPGDEVGLKRLGINVTSDPQFSSSALFSA